MTKNPDFIDSELKEFIDNVRKNHLIRFVVFISFLLLSLILKFAGVVVPWLVIIVIILLLLINILCEYLAIKLWPKQTPNQVNLSYFIFQVLEVVALLAAISEFEGVLFGGIAILMVYVMFCYLGFTQKLYPRIIVILCIFGYTIAGLLKYFKILPYIDIHGLGINPYNNRALVTAVMSFMIGAFFYVSFYGDIFSQKLRRLVDLLRNRTSQLVEKEEELKDAKTILEIKVQSRTRELKELTQSLNEQIGRSTKELQNKIQELEKFQKLSVGRELKMIELKKELQALKKTIRKN